MQVGVFLSDMQEGKSLQFKVRKAMQPAWPALASCYIPVLQIVQSTGDLNG